MKPKELADELEAQGEGYKRTLKPAWTGDNRDEALALIIVVADNLPAILSALRRVEKLEAALTIISKAGPPYQSTGEAYTGVREEALAWAGSVARQALTGEA